jgi:mannose-6-phosphate isomerase-like protein (cupin superfamily)
MPVRKILLLFFILFSVTSSAQLKPVESGVYRWNEAAVKKAGQRETRKLAEGSTSEFEYFEIHATTQQKGAIAKPAYTQKDLEELIIIKEGTMKCTIGNNTAVLGKGSVLLIPPLEQQSFENTGDGPLTYYVLKFRSKKPMDIERSNKAGGVLLLNHDSLAYTEKNNRGTRKYFDRATAMCENYEMHVTYLKNKGASHTPHQHADTEIILMTEGETEMTIDGKHYTAGPGDLYIIESGKMHGVGNATEKPCSYFAFKWR